MEPVEQPGTFQEISQLIWEHARARGWHHNPPRGLAISIALEASELLEHYQWGDQSVGSKEDLAAELADIFIYAFEFAQAEGIAIDAAIRQKLAASAKKYPAENFQHKTPAENHQAWLDAKLHHKKKNL
ncbi:MAG TPA: MazG-like family protein [Candidatus Saccharimonadales bacterium]|nr:MazG-like family protein [Candidatus Saccharimonadales bacterium]